MGIENLTFHDLRLTYNTNLRRAGVRRGAIMKLTGHQTQAMFNRYNTVDSDDAAIVMDGYEEFMKRLAGGTKDYVNTAQQFMI